MSVVTFCLSFLHFIHTHMGVIWWGTGGGGGGDVPHNWQWVRGGTDNLMSPSILGWKKSTYFNIYLRFAVICTGLIRTICSHSLPIFKYSEHVQYIYILTPYNRK